MKHGRGVGKRRKAAAAQAQGQTQGQSEAANNQDSQKAFTGIMNDWSAWQPSYAGIFEGQAAVAPMLGTISPPSTSSSSRPSLAGAFSRTPSSDSAIMANLADDLLFGYQAPFDFGNRAAEQVSTEMQFEVVHDCYDLAHSTMALLSFHPRPRSLASPARDGTLENSQDYVLDLVDVLQGIKRALDNANEIAKCWCLYDDSRMTLLFGSIVMRILYWHRVASGKASSYISQSSPSRGCDLSSTHTRLGQLVPITSELVTIGNFVPDAEEQDTIRRTHLTRSLKKTQDLIESFSSMGESHRIIANSLRAELTQALNEG